MYTKRYNFESFISFIRKRGRGGYLLLEELRAIWVLYEKGMNTGKNIDMVEAKNKINRLIAQYRSNRKTWIGSESEAFKKFLTFPWHFCSYFTGLVDFDHLTGVYTQLTIEFSDVGGIAPVANSADKSIPGGYHNG